VGDGSLLLGVRLGGEDDVGVALRGPAQELLVRDDERRGERLLPALGRAELAQRVDV
jgi:hypothetical protein